MGAVWFLWKQKGVVPLIRYFTTAMLVNGKEWSLFKHMDDVIMIGYPKGIYDEKNNQPIFLKGSLAANPSDVIYRDLFQKYGSCHSWFD